MTQNIYIDFLLSHMKNCKKKFCNLLMNLVNIAKYRNRILNTLAHLGEVLKLWKIQCQNSQNKS